MSEALHARTDATMAQIRARLEQYAQRQGVILPPVTTYRPDDPEETVTENLEEINRALAVLNGENPYADDE